MLDLADPADLDNGPRTGKAAGTERMCAVSRQVKPIGELIRFVVGPSGELVADLKRKLPGRGLWLTASRRTVAEAAKRHIFAKGFKRDIRVAPTLPDDIDALLVRGTLDALAIAAKAGQVISGFTRVEAALQSREAVGLLHASDGAADGIRKLDAVARQNDLITTPSRDFPVVTVLTSAQLDLALGRSNVIHAALLAGSAGQTFLSRCQILVRYRLVDDSNAGADKPSNKASDKALDAGDHARKTLPT